MSHKLKYAALFFAIGIFAISANPGFSSAAFADVQTSSYSHSHATASTDPNLVCWDHPCAPGEKPVHFGQ